MIEGATHELGLWHFPEYYPKNWKLDEMEGAQVKNMFNLKVPIKLGVKNTDKCFFQS